MRSVTDEPNLIDPDVCVAERFSVTDGSTVPRVGDHERAVAVRAGEPVDVPDATCGCRKCDQLVGSVQHVELNVRGARVVGRKAGFELVIESVSRFDFSRGNYASGAKVRVRLHPVGCIIEPTVCWIT